MKAQNTCRKQKLYKYNHNSIRQTDCVEAGPNTGQK